MSTGDKWAVGLAVGAIVAAIAAAALSGMEIERLTEASGGAASADAVDPDPASQRQAALARAAGSYGSSLSSLGEPVPLSAPATVPLVQARPQMRINSRLRTATMAVSGPVLVQGGDLFMEDGAELRVPAGQSVSVQRLLYSKPGAPAGSAPAVLGLEEALALASCVLEVEIPAPASEPYSVAPGISVAQTQAGVPFEKAAVIGGGLRAAPLDVLAGMQVPLAAFPALLSVVRTAQLAGEGPCVLEFAHPDPRARRDKQIAVFFSARWKAKANAGAPADQMASAQSRVSLVVHSGTRGAVMASKPGLAAAAPGEWRAAVSAQWFIVTPVDNGEKHKISVSFALPEGGTRPPGFAVVPISWHLRVLMF